MPEAKGSGHGNIVILDPPLGHFLYIYDILNNTIFWSNDILGNRTAYYIPHHPWFPKVSHPECQDSGFQLVVGSEIENTKYDDL